MLCRINRFLITGLLLFTAASVPAAEEKPPEAAINSPLRFRMDDIDGDPVDLAQYKGRVVLLVNVASKCGLTPQYQALQALYRKYNERGFTILAFPANNFKQQEPGTDQEIKAFCSANYGVTFPLFSKVSVKGEDICPLYQYLTTDQTNPGFSGEIPWNFTKFLLDRRGRVVGRFEPGTAPDDEAVVSVIEKKLAGE